MYCLKNLPYPKECFGERQTEFDVGVRLYEKDNRVDFGTHLYFRVVWM